MELKVWDNELSYEVLFNQNPIPMWFFDLDTHRFLEVNKAAIEHYGYSKEEFLSMTIEDIRPEDDLEMLSETLASLTSNPTSKRKFRHILKDGSLNHVEIVSYPVIYKGYNSRLVHVINITDIILQKERFELVSKATHDTLWDWDLKNNKIWWNKSLETMFGYKLETIDPTVSFWENHIHPEDRQEAIRNFRENILTAKENWSDTYRFRKADGSYAWIYDRKFGIIRGGKTIRILGSMMDVTRQVTDRQARKESEEFLKSITTASPAALWMSDDMGNVIYVNQRWIEWSKKDFQGNLGDGWMECIHPGDRQKVREAYYHAHGSKSIYQVDFRITYADQSVRWVESTGYPRFSTDGSFAGFVGSCADITKQQHLQMQKDEFISTVSHELKTPMTSIKAYCQLLIRSLKKNNLAESESFLSRMSSQINRVHRLINELLDISRIERGTLSLQRSTFYLNKVVRELLDDLQIVVQSHELELTHCDECLITADKQRIIQVIINLINNAIKYSPEKDKVIISLRVNDGGLLFSVTDFGVGIPEEQKPFIFDRFYQINDVYNNPGLGMGLYICKEIITGEGGKIWVDSSYGHGSTFCFSLPRDVAE